MFIISVRSYLDQAPLCHCVKDEKRRHSTRPCQNAPCPSFYCKHVPPLRPLSVHALPFTMEGDCHAHGKGNIHKKKKLEFDESTHKVLSSSSCKKPHHSDHSMWIYEPSFHCFFIHAFMGKPPKLMWSPSMSADPSPC